MVQRVLGLVLLGSTILGASANCADLFVSSFFTNQILRYNGSTGAFIDIFASLVL